MALNVGLRVVESEGVVVVVVLLQLNLGSDSLSLWLRMPPDVLSFEGRTYEY